MKVNLRNFEPGDRPVIETILSRIKVFSREDQALAMELVDIALNQPDQKDYDFCVAVDEEDRAVGYACFGPTPLTDGTYDLYWIAVDPACEGQGIGTLILNHVEYLLSKQNGRLIVIETSSDLEYESTRRFYLKNGYIHAETIKDFFRKGEDRVTYLKVLRD